MEEHIYRSECCFFEDCENSIDLTHEEVEVFYDICCGYKRDYGMLRKYMSDNVRNIGDLIRLSTNLTIFYQDKLKDNAGIFPKNTAEVYNKYILTLKKLVDTIHDTYNNYYKNLEIYENVMHNIKNIKNIENIGEMNATKISVKMRDVYTIKWIQCVKYFIDNNDMMNRSRCKELLIILVPTNIIKICNKEMVHDVVNLLQRMVDVSIKHGCYKGDEIIVPIVNMYRFYDEYAKKYDDSTEKYLNTIVDRIPYCYIKVYNETMEYIGRYEMVQSIMYVLIVRMVKCKLCCCM